MENTVNRISDEIRKITEQKSHCLIAIDGRCASGKSTLASMLHEKLGGALVHMDDFFLRPEQRTKERYSTPGENVDHERFLEEVLMPLSKGETARFHPFDCNTMSLSETVLEADGSGLVIVEGSYSHHPLLRDYYDLKLFLHVQLQRQLERIAKRNPAKLEDFKTKWIPFEELYFSNYDVMNKADLVIETTNLF